MIEEIVAEGAATAVMIEVVAVVTIVAVIEAEGMIEVVAAEVVVADAASAQAQPHVVGVGVNAPALASAPPSVTTARGSITQPMPTSVTSSASKKKSSARSVKASPTKACPNPSSTNKFRPLRKSNKR